MRLSACFFAAALAASLTGLIPVYANDGHGGTTVHIGIHPTTGPAMAHGHPAPVARHAVIAPRKTATVATIKRERRVASVMGRHRGHCHCWRDARRHGHWRFAGGHHRWHHFHSGYGLNSNDGYGGYGGYGDDDYADTYAGGPPVEYGMGGYDNDEGYGAPVIADEPGSGGRYSVWGGYNPDNGVNNFF